ncbi:MAG: SCO family protein [Gammaproteobacteria bacterium]|nr:SCO family protein [Gammaproteobacteria bacterium]
MRGIIIVLSVILAACAPPPLPFNATEVTGVSYGTQLQIPDTQGKSRSLADFSGKITVVFFGFTSCPDVCPSTLMRLGQLRKSLGADGAAVQVILVTVDPERDTASRLDVYVKNFDPSFIGLRPEPAALESVVKAFHAIAVKVPTADGTDYTIDHSSTIYVYDQNTRMRLIAQADMPIEQLAADLRRLIADS